MSQQEKETRANLYLALFKEVFINVSSKYNSEFAVEQFDEELIKRFEEVTGFGYKSEMFRLFWAFVKGLDLAALMFDETPNADDSSGMAELMA